MTATATWSVRPSRTCREGHCREIPRPAAPGMLPPRRRRFGGRQVVQESACNSLCRPPCCRKRINSAGQLAAGNAAEAGTCGLTRAPGRSSGPAPPAPATESAPGQNDGASALIPRSRLITYRERTLRRRRAEYAEYALGRFGIGLGQSARRSSRSGVTVRWAHGDNGAMACRPAPPLGEPGLVRQDPFRVLPHNLIRLSRVPR